METQKLYSFPKIYCVSMEKDVVRRDFLLQQLSSYNIADKIYFNISKTFEEANEWWTGDNYISNLCNAGKSLIINHLKNIKHWLSTTSNSDTYAFFCEDDVSFETVRYWNFNWLEFINALPKDWDCIQLHSLRTHSSYSIKNDDIKLHIRNWYSWGTTCFLLKRTYAEKLINTHFSSQGVWQLISQIQTPFLDPSNSISKDLHRYPYTEHIIYGSSCNIYTTLLLLDNYLKFSTTYSPDKSEHQKRDSELESYGIGHIAAYNFIKNWWCENRQHTLQDIMFKG